MEYKLEKNNNKKVVIILISIIFCILILLAGGTYAFFGQGGSNTLDIATTDLDKTLKYTSGSNEYMRDNLIPVVVTDVEKFAMKNTENGYDDNSGICKYENFGACSLYEFTIENTSNVFQIINATLTPNPNTFTNLYYMIYEGEQESLTPDSPVVKIKTHLDGNNTSKMFEEVELKAGESKTYTLVFYILSTDYDQTNTDLGKNFGAIVSINSVTTGYNITKTYGTPCYELEKITGGEFEGTFRLTRFTGINNVKREIVEDCGVTQNEETNLYTVEIPSQIGDYEISTLGNNLFNALTIDENGMSVNENINIEKITISEGIKEIDDGRYLPEQGIFVGTFLGIGGDLMNRKADPSRTLEVTFPSTLKKIGKSAFTAAALRILTIPKNVEVVEDGAFVNASNLTDVTITGALDGTSKLQTIGLSAFEGVNISSITIPNTVTSIGNGAFSEISSLNSVTIIGANDETSKLQIIGANAFYGTNISKIAIPNTVTTIGHGAFNEISSLNSVTIIGANDETSKLQIIGDSAFSSTDISSIIIPKTVTTIGANAFNNVKSLTSVTFIGATNNTSKLQTIGNNAFQGTNVSEIVIPKTVTTIGDGAFRENSNLTYVTFMGALEGTSKLHTIGAQAFYNCDLSYPSTSNPLILPPTLTKIGFIAFQGNSNLKYIYIIENDEQQFEDGWYYEYNTTIIREITKDE